uniref:Uncharacterized protein n=1 Tax=Arundo donax TaxID=35708 RepID=A0A0A8YR69_ARUDO
MGGGVVATIWSQACEST